LTSQHSIQRKIIAAALRVNNNNDENFLPSL
jgi:hypothetical protein